jgi:hypothetical protein
VTLFLPQGVVALFSKLRGRGAAAQGEAFATPAPASSPAATLAARAEPSEGRA